jgi:spore coat polysaccharide biosynthesis protein SpsF
MHIVTVIQARMGSSRLPNKVLFPVIDKPMLIIMLERVMRAKHAGTIVVATTICEADDIIYNLCQSHGFNCFRGDPSDLVDRHFNVAMDYMADAIVKIPSDCPLIDPDIIDRVIGEYIQNYPKYDFVSNLHPATYPDGNDVEIMSFATLEKVWKEASKDFEREHTTPYIWENPKKFEIGNVCWETGLDYSSTYRWTIDYEEDYLFIKSVYELLYPIKPAFGINDILQLLITHPKLNQINKKYIGKYWYENHLTQLNQIDEYKNKLKK